MKNTCDNFGEDVPNKLRQRELSTATDLKLKFFLEQSSEVIFTVDLHGLITFVNPAWSLLTGYALNESMGKSIRDFIHPDDVSKCFPLFLGEQNNCFYVKFITKQQQIVLLGASIHVMIEDNVLTKFGSLLDLTGSIRNQEALKKSNERFHLATTVAVDGLWDWSAITQEWYLSPRWKEMLGYNDDELTNEFATWTERLHPDEAVSVDYALKSVLDDVTKDHYQLTHRLKNKAGEWLWVLCHAKIIRDQQGKVERMAGSITDISLLKETEKQLNNRQQELDAIINLSPDGIVTINHGGSVHSVNAMFLTFTGLTAQSFLGKTQAQLLATLKAISLPDCPAEITTGSVFKLLPASIFAHLAPQVNEGVGKNKVVNQLSSSRVLKVNVCELSTDVIHTVMYFQDITQEIEIDRMKYDFLTNAAHELRTPLSSVFGFTELLITRQFDPKTQQDIFANLHHQAQFLVKILNDILELAKIEARLSKEFHLTQYALGAVIKEGIALFTQEHTGCVINYLATAEVPWLFIDAEYIKQALFQVLSNALKFSPEGSMITVAIVGRGEGVYEQVGIAIKDVGVGMTQNDLNHIFERFWRGSNTHNIAGIGIGMALVHEIINFHRGHIEITSEPDVGTEVVLWLNAHAI